MTSNQCAAARDIRIYHGAKLNERSARCDALERGIKSTLEPTDYEPLSILLVITELDPGGAEKCICDLAIFLHAGGHRVKLLALGPRPVGTRAILVDRLQAAAVPTEFGDAKRIADLPRIVPWLKRQILDFQPNVVQSMLWHANVTCAVAVRPRTVSLVGGVRVSDPSRWRSWIQGLLSRRFKKIVCVSRDVANWCRQRERIPGSKLVVIPNGIQLQPIDRNPSDWTRLGLPAEAQVLLVLGRLEKQKGCAELLRHADAILSQLGESYLVMMGQGSQEAQLKSIASQCKHNSRIRFVGWHPEAASWIASSRLLLLPAIYEGMPNVLLEAMERARPFVAFGVDGVRELVDGASEELADAQIANAGDWEGYCNKVIRLTRDEDMHARIGQLNREQIAQRYQLAEQLSKYQSLYRSLVRSPAAT